MNVLVNWIVICIIGIFFFLNFWIILGFVFLFLENFEMFDVCVLYWYIRFLFLILMENLFEDKCNLYKFYLLDVFEIRKV